MITVRWCFNTRNFVNTSQNWTKCLSSIQSEEVQRLSEFMHKNSVISSLIGRLMLRKWANHSLGVEWRDANFARTDRGRPYLLPSCDHDHNVAQKDDIAEFTDVNVSHQGDWVVLAASEGGVVGVDVMKTTYSGGKPVQEFFRLMKRQFTPSEWSSIRGGDCERAQLEGFYRHWCLKESVVKALGVGITLSLQRVSFNVGPKPGLADDAPIVSTSVAVDGKSSGKWVFEESLLSEEYCGCIAFLPVDITAGLDLLTDRMILLDDSDSNRCEVVVNEDSNDGVHRNEENDLSDSIEKLHLESKKFTELTIEELLEGSQTVTDVSEEMVHTFIDKPTVPWL